MANLKTQVIVLGCGAVGSSALYELSRNNIQAVGIDQYGINRKNSKGN